MSENDVTLARRVVAGDEAAFEAFFERYFPRLFRFALPRVDGNEDWAEDVVQLVMIRAVQRMRTYRGEASLLTWLCTICRHEIATWREREGRLREVSLFDDRAQVRAALETLTHDDAADPDVAMRRRELSELVRLTLDQLPGHYGDVLEWRYIEGVSVAEIASRLCVGYKAAESLLTRARREAGGWAPSEES
jgi:RNA polymerase sigma-70 factor (ECF subfamily)